MHKRRRRREPKAVSLQTFGELAAVVAELRPQHEIAVRDLVRTATGRGHATTTEHLTLYRMMSGATKG